MKMKEVKVKGAYIRFREDGIIHIHYDDDLLDLETVQPRLCNRIRNEP